MMRVVTRMDSFDGSSKDASCSSTNKHIESVANVLHKHIKTHYFSSPSPGSVYSEFDADEFLPVTYRVNMFPFLGPLMSYMGIYSQTRRRSPSRLPKQEHVLHHLRSIFQHLKISPECCVISLIYITRLREAGFPLTTTNWRTMIIAACLSASKIWDDVSIWNVDICELFPVLGIAALNRLEVLFLESINYNLQISPQEYADYYFSLHSLRVHTTTQLATVAATRSASSNASSLTNRFLFQAYSLSPNDNLFSI